jgi:predicted small lipoprotein YifL|tara:strand:+ start:166 stop:351 length:186 start_codon:yes stop_codon:yes gene_type:complete
MKKLLFAVLALTFSSFVYAGCGGCGPNSCGSDEKTTEKSDCSKDKVSCDKKEKKTSCCPSK